MANHIKMADKGLLGRVEALEAKNAGLSGEIRNFEKRCRELEIEREAMVRAYGVLRQKLLGQREEIREISSERDVLAEEYQELMHNMTYASLMAHLESLSGRGLDKQDGVT